MTLYKAKSIDIYAMSFIENLKYFNILFVIHLF